MAVQYEDAYVVKSPKDPRFMLAGWIGGGAIWVKDRGEALRWPTKHQARAARDATDEWQLPDREPARDEGLEYLGFGTPCGYKCVCCGDSLTDRFGLVQPLGRFTVCTTCGPVLKWFVKQLPEALRKSVRDWLKE